MKTFLVTTTMTVLMSQSAIAGTWQGVSNAPSGGCVAVPENTLCLSECGFAALKGDKTVVPASSRLGLHFPYDPDTLETDLLLILSVQLFLNEYAPRIRISDMMKTTPRIFLDPDTKELFNWMEVRDNYKTVTSSASDLVACK